ncbi:MAG: hypothetical protein LVR00_05370 [Rhabdochlamydiaceae bacterium]
MSTPIKDVQNPTYQEPLITTPTLADADDSISSLLLSLEGNTDVSQKELTQNMIALLRSIQSLLASLQEGQSKKATLDSETQKTIVSMNESLSKELKKELDNYLKALKKYEKNKLVADIFGAILPFLVTIFPPLLVMYPMGPFTLMLDPNAPFGMGVLGEKMEEDLGKGAALGISIGIEITITIVGTIFTFGGMAAIRAGGAGARAAMKALLKEALKDVALYATAKTLTHEEVLPHIVTGIVKMAEGMSGKKLSEEDKAIVQIVVTLVIQVALMIVVLKVKSNSSNESIFGNISKSPNFQKACIAIMLVLQGAQSGIQMWSGANTIETAKIQKIMKELQAMELELKGIDSTQKTKIQNTIKELQRYFETITPHNLDLEGVVGKSGEKTAQIISK